jgi:hypothetical protein
MPSGVVLPKSEYERGFMLWRMREKLSPTALTLLETQPYYVLLMEGEGEVADHACGSDCVCWKKI